MNLKHARGMWVDEQIFELQSQMAMVHKFFKRLEKSKGMGRRKQRSKNGAVSLERGSYGDEFPLRDQSLFRSSFIEQGNMEGASHYPFPLEDNDEPYYEQEISSGLDVSSPPIFDSYEENEEQEDFPNPFVDNMCSESKENSVATSNKIANFQILSQGFEGAIIMHNEGRSCFLGVTQSVMRGILPEHEAWDFHCSVMHTELGNSIACSKEQVLNHTNQVLEPDLFSFIMEKEDLISLFTQQNDSHLYGKLRIIKCIRENYLKNSYTFKKGGVYSTLLLGTMAEFKPGVHNGLLNDDNTTPKSSNANTHSWTRVLFGAQTRSAKNLTTATSLKVPWIYGEGLLAYYIEDDELKDVKGLFPPHSDTAP